MRLVARSRETHSCGQMDHDPADRTHGADAELQDVTAQDPHLGMRTSGPGGAEPEFLHQDVGGGR